MASKAHSMVTFLFTRIFFFHVRIWLKYACWGYFSYLSRDFFVKFLRFFFQRSLLIFKNCTFHCLLMIVKTVPTEVPSTRCTSPTFESIDCIPISKIKTAAVVTDKRHKNPRGRLDPIIGRMMSSQSRKILLDFSHFSFSSLYRSILRPINFQSSFEIENIYFSLILTSSRTRTETKDFSINFHSAIKHDDDRITFLAFSTENIYFLH